MVCADLLPADAPLRQLRGLVNVFKANSQARYTLDVVLPVPMVLFRASERHPMFDYSQAEDPGVPPDQSTLGWKAFVREPVTVHAVPGNHLTMMNAPHVTILGRHLHGYLAEPERAYGWATRAVAPAPAGHVGATPQKEGASS